MCQCFYSELHCVMSLSLVMDGLKKNKFHFYIKAYLPALGQRVGVRNTTKWVCETVGLRTCQMRLKTSGCMLRVC